MASKDCLPNRLQKKLVGFFTNEFFILKNLFNTKNLAISIIWYIFA